MTSKTTDSATSLPESPVGPSPSSSPDGNQTDLFGQPVALAHRSVSQGKKLHAQNARARTLSGALDELATQYARRAITHGLPTPGTYGRKCGGLQPSADLQQSLESRLRAMPGLTGSLLYKVHWKSSVTLLGARISRLQASGHRTSVKDFGGWPTPQVPTGGQGTGHAERKGRSYYSKDGKKVQLSLQAAAKLAGWPSPMAGTPKQKCYNEAGNTDASRRTVGLIIPGATSNGSPAQTEQPDRLNPDFSRWLQGFPEDWGRSAPTETRSSHK